jgi:hypothetical protein
MFSRNCLYDKCKDDEWKLPVTKSLFSRLKEDKGWRALTTGLTSLCELPLLLSPSKVGVINDNTIDNPTPGATQQIPVFNKE